MTDTNNSTDAPYSSPSGGGREGASLFTYCLHLADNTLILAQRNSEWCGHGPLLEQDIAITNISLDLLGQARNFYQYAASIYNDMGEEAKKEVDRLAPLPWKDWDRDLNEDDLAFLREEKQYLNVQLSELPNGDWAQTILRQFFFSAFQFYQYAQLQKSRDMQLAAIAEKSIKEVTYHLKWSSEWVIRLGDGTEESHQRMINAVNELWPFTGELFTPTRYELQAVTDGFGVGINELQKTWIDKVEQVFSEAAIPSPEGGNQAERRLGTGFGEGASWQQQGGKEGLHTEYMGYVLTEMQYLQRTYPNVAW